MGIPPIGAIGTEPIVYNVQRLTSVRPKSTEEISKNGFQKTEENNAISSRRQFDTVEFSSAEAPPDFKAIDLIKKSEITPPEPPEADKTRTVETKAEETKIQETAETENLIENSATVKTSEEIETQSTASKLTPSQKQGVEAYQKVQNYISPLNMSNARVAV